MYIALVRRSSFPSNFKGMILWELLTGGSPYEHLQIESFEELIEEICKKGTREKIPKDTPQCLKNLIQVEFSRKIP